MRIIILFIFFILFSNIASATQDIPAITITDAAGSKSSVSVSLQIVAVMTALAILPALILTMTSFTRVVIVLGILRQAIGMPQTPSNQILIGLSLFLTFYIMAPVFSEVNKVSISPYINEKVNFTTAVKNASLPVRNFMLTQTREVDMEIIKGIANYEDKAEEDVPFSILIPAFITSELKTAFQIGFLLFVPFLVIDLVVASVLMAMGMMMLSPLIISLPFKIMLFILIDGWSLVVATLASSFGMQS